MPKSHRGKTHKKGKTASKKVLTIPELRSSMEYITTYSESLVHGKSKSVKELAAEFAKEWKKVFGKKLAPHVAEQYIRHMMQMKKKPSKTRKMRGGAAVPLAGGPLGLDTTRPGTDLPYGNFPSYVSKGFWNPEPAILQDCGKQTGVLPYAELGSNKMQGGGIIDSISNGLSAIGMRPFVAQNPTTPQADAMSMWKGTPVGPGPEAWQQTWKSQMPSRVLPPIPGMSVYNRDLTVQGRV